MSWWDQAKTFFNEVKNSKSKEVADEKVSKEDLEYVTSVSEARLLAAPEGASFLIIIVTILGVVLVAWSLLMQVDEVVKAEGKVIPSKQVQVIQNLEGGIVREINVVEGQNVKKDDVLIVIDDVSAKSDVDENVNSYNATLARLVALNALIAGKRVLNFPMELNSYIEVTAHARERFNEEGNQVMNKILELESVMTQRKKEYDSALNEKRTQESNYKLSKQELKLNEPLLQSGAISQVEFLHIQQKVNEAQSKLNNAINGIPKAKAALNEAMQRRDSYISESKVAYEKERNEIQAKLNTMQSKGVSLQAKLSHSIVKSPVVGTVKKININTIGGVLRPGENILEIIPTDDKLLIEAKVKPKDIGFIHVGLSAKVKLTAYDFSTYGGLDGKVVFVSADTITDKKGISFFLVRVLTDKNTITDKKGIAHTIIPGMQTEVDIVVDQKSIMAYILKPMLK